MSDGTNVRDDTCLPSAEGEQMIRMVEEHYGSWPIVKRYVGERIVRMNVKDDGVELQRPGAHVGRSLEPRHFWRELDDLSASFPDRVNKPRGYREFVLHRKQDRVTL